MLRFVGLSIFAAGCGTPFGPDEDEISVCDRLTATAGDDVGSTLGTTVVLDGEGDACDSTVYQWRFDVVPEGSQISVDDLSDNNSPTAHSTSFTPDVSGSYVLGFRLADGDVVSPADVVVVDVEAGDLPPVADCGDVQDGKVGVSVTFDGSGSFDPEGTPLQYHWVLAGAPDCSALGVDDITNSEVTSIVIPDCGGVYTAALTVDDGVHTSNIDYCTLEVAGTNELPVADAGPGGSVRACDGGFLLDGYSSYDTETFDLLYKWSVIGVPKGSLATDAAFEDATIVAPIFHPDQDGEYTFSLQVYDGELWSVPDIAVYQVQVGGC